MEIYSRGSEESRHVTREFDDYLACGQLENGFNTCAARRMVETTALLVDGVLPHRPVR